MEQNISICPVCGHVYGHSVAEQIPCGDCGKSMTVFSGYTSDKWDALPMDARVSVVHDIKSRRNELAKDPDTGEKVYASSDSAASNIVYNNPGRSIATYATICCLASVILDLFVAIGLHQLLDGKMVLIPIVVFIVLCIMSYLSYLLLAGFGTLVENSSKIVQLLNDKNDR